MDVENSHPFCLPFGFCHDATSSSLTAQDFASNYNNNDIMNNNNDCDGMSNKTNRSKTSSPYDEMFRRLNNAASSSSATIGYQSLLSDDIIINGGDTSAGDGSFYSLDLGDNTEDDDNPATSLDANYTSDAIFTTDIDDGDDPHFQNEEDFYSDQLISALSPPGLITDHQQSYNNNNHHLQNNLTSSRQKKSLIKTNNQVFQHVLDTHNIKSSPTLAQLNLNSNDDPNDGLWDMTVASTSSTLMLNSNSSSSISANTDLFKSNCTSIVANRNLLSSLHGSHCTTNLSHQNQLNQTACGHLRPQQAHQHTHYSNYHHQLCPSHHLTNVSSTYDHHHHHHHSSDLMRGYTSPTANQSTCLAVTPFRKPANHPHYHQNHILPCCSSLLTAAPQSMIENNPIIPTVKTAISTSASLPTQTSNNVAGDQIGANTLSNPRSASPAQVTSSSSPLSTSLNNLQNETARPSENNLKKNIDYLTALLCNGGNKIESSNKESCCIQQQLPISSSMVKPYSTLSHSLSVGPKLLEQHQAQPHNITSREVNGQLQQHTHHTPVIVETSTCSQQANEASSCATEIQQVTDHVSSSLKGSSADQWFKSNVESSVSAADSTDCQLSSVTMTTSLHSSASRGPTPLTNCGQNCQDNRDGKLSDLKVLSSLLNAGRSNSNQAPCAPIFHSHVPMPQMHPHQDTASGWQDRTACNQILVQQQPQMSLQSQAQPMSVGSPYNQQQQQNNTAAPYQQPANGKLITLTPVASQNSLTISQQNAQKSRLKNLFAQPASPSASSTASSGNNVEIGSTSGSSNSSLTAPISSIKRQRSANSNQSSAASLKSSTNSSKSKTTGGGRTGRPSSLSTDCSLSSHDEGFSSHIDNDECNSNRDSDEDDEEVDSDDESFYGDYTNSDLIGASISDDLENKWTLNMGRTRRNGQKRYFWQYNVQSKGPKGSRICQTDDSADPFILSEASDPVFSSDCQVEGVKHSGKARRGDGNDLTPNPRKLLMIGLELKKLGKTINELAFVADLPINARNKTRKEKNKLASRACRLKKKAQHEANKIKLYGLQREHQQAVKGICEIRKFLRKALEDKETATDRASLLCSSGGDQSVGNDLDISKTKLECAVNDIIERCSMKVAGQTSDYVNSVLEKVTAGFIDGGLET